jgi:multidrug efflux system membrane fusion protein
MHRDTTTPPVTPHPTGPAPQPRPAPPRTGGGGHWLTWLVFLAALGALGYYGYRAWAEQAAAKGTKGPPAAKVTPVVTATASKGSLDLYLEEIGTVTPLNSVTVKSRVDGQIMKIGFVEGQAVKEGDLIAEIDPRPFQVQLAQAQAQLARDEATLKNARADLERYRQAADTVTKQQMDTQVAAVEQDEAVLKTDQAMIDNARLQLTYCHITAPIGGRIGLRQVDVGNMVRANDSTGIAVITQLQPINVTFSIPESQIGRVVRAVSAAGSGRLKVDAYDDDNVTKIASGVLTAIDNQVDPTTGTVRLKAEFPNADGALFPNEFVRAHLLVETLRDVVLIPAAAAQLGPPPNENFVYVVTGGDTVELRNIKPGPTDGERTVVLDGIRPGDVVVTDGVDKLVPGAKVTVHPEGGVGATSRPAGGKRGGHGLAATTKGTRGARGAK